MAKKIDYATLYILRKDGRYQGYYTDAKGRHCVCDKDPEKLYFKLQAKINAAPSVPTFKDVADQWWVAHVEKLERGTIATYKAPFEKAVAASGSLLITDVSASDIDRELKAEKLQGYSYKHAASLKSMYKQILDFAIVQKHIAVNPVSAVKVPRGMPRGKREAPEKDFVDRIKKGLHEPFGNFAAVLLYTGMRTEEAAALQWGDIDLTSGFITVARAVDLHGTPLIKDTKTDAGRRTIPIVSALRPFLVKPAAAAPTDYVFNLGGKLLTRSQITSRWLNWCKAVGLAHQVVRKNRHRGEKECTRTEWRADVTPHQFRHNYATVLFEAEIDELTAQNLMGHTDIAFTRSIYTSLRKKHKEEQLKKLEGAF